MKNHLRLLCVLLLPAMVGLWIFRASPPAFAAPKGVAIAVTTGLDDDGSTCDSNSCTLRGAINKSNSNGQTYNVIEFAQTVTTVFVTNAPLPTITSPGTTINGSYNNAFPRIYGANGGTFFINANYVNIVFLTIVNTTNGADIEIDGGTNIAIGNNYLGTVKGAPNCAFVSTQQGTNGVLVKYPFGSSASPPAAYIYGNVISCHQHEGILVGGATVKIGHDRSDNVVRNLIGVTDDGVHAVGNGFAGVAIEDWVYSANDNLVEGNVISGNGREGIYVSGTSGTRITGNFIGLSAYPMTTTTPIPNGLAGIALFAASGALIGGRSAYNLIAANTREGIYIKDGGNSSVDLWNAVGAPVPAGNAELACVSGWGNGLAGILLDGNPMDWTISPGMVGCNGLAGIATTASAFNGRNRIMPFVVGRNGGLPIDRNYDGKTPINYPGIASISLNGSNVTFAGTACANCDVSVYAARGNPAAPGGGGRLLRNATANNAGQWSVTVLSYSVTPFVSVLAPSSLSAHAYDPSTQGTYGMSPRPQLSLPLIQR